MHFGRTQDAFSWISETRLSGKSGMTLVLWGAFFSNTKKKNLYSFCSVTNYIHWVGCAIKIRILEKSITSFSWRTLLWCGSISTVSTLWISNDMLSSLPRVIPNTFADVVKRRKRHYQARELPCLWTRSSSWCTCSVRDMMRCIMKKGPLLRGWPSV